MQEFPFDGQIQRQEKTLGIEYAELLQNEEKFYADKSRTQWLKVGDRTPSSSSEKYYPTQPGIESRS